VSYNDNSVLTETISEGLARLFPGFEGDVGDSIGSPTEPTPDDPETPVDDDAPVVSTDAAELLQIADDLFRQADEALADGNLGEYQTKVDEGRRRLDEAIVILEADLQN